MAKSKIFKKIIPGFLIIIILSIGFFGAFDINNAEALPVKDNNSTATEINKNVSNTFKGIMHDYTPIGFFIDKRDALCLSADGFRNCIAILGQTVLEIFGWILAVTGLVLNKTVEITVIEMGAKVGGIGTIEVGWKIFRDLANILIIFSLLYIGIITILNLKLGGYDVKKLLVSLIIAAVFINFSLFFTKVIIDSSNLLAVNFYEKIKNEGIGKASNPRKWGGISDSYMQALRFTVLYKTNNEDKIEIRNPAIGTEVFSIDPETGQFKESKIFGSEKTKTELNKRQMIFIALFGVILYLITAFSFLAAAFLLIVRYAVLIFLMILSPIAFAGMILPKMKTYSSMWWKSLISHSFYAPVYFLLTYIVVIMINSEGFKTAIGFEETGTSVIYIIINFSVIIVFIILTVLLSKQMGIWGSNTVIGWGQSARKWGQGMAGGATFGMGGRILRNTAGRRASKWADSEKIKERAASGGIRGILGKMQLRGLRGVAGSSFDARAAGVGGAVPGGLGKMAGKGGYEAKLQKQVKEREKFAESLGKESYDEQLHKQGLVLEIGGLDGKSGKQKEYKDAQKMEKIAIDNFEQTTEQNKTKIKNAKEKMDNAKLDTYKDIYKKEYEKMLEDTKAEQDILENTKKIRTAERKAKETALNEAKETLQDYKPGVDRQNQYADTLEKEKTADTAFIKISRKNKIASLKIKKNIKEFPKKKALDYITEALKENKDSAGEAKPEDKSSATV